MNTKINIENYLEWFCMFADKELTCEQQQEVLLFVKNNPSLASDFEYIQQTILDSTAIDADFKKELYKGATIIPFTNKKRITNYIAVAASILALLGGSYVYFLNNNNSITNELNPVATTNVQPTPVITKTKNTEQIVATEKINETTPKADVKKVAQSIKKEEVVVKINTIKQQQIETPRVAVANNKVNIEIQRMAPLVKNAISNKVHTAVLNIQKLEPNTAVVIQPKETNSAVANILKHNTLFQTFVEQGKEKIENISNNHTAMAIANNQNTKNVVQKIKNSMLYESVSEDVTGTFNRVRSGLRQLGITH